MDDVLWARIEAKREQNRRFLQLEADAAKSQQHYRAPKMKVKKTRTPAPKRRVDPAAREEVLRDREVLRKHAAELQRTAKRAQRIMTRALRASIAIGDKEASKEARSELRWHIAEIRASQVAAQKAFRRRRKLYREPRPLGRPRTRGDHCLGCDRPYRERHEKIADRPGTVRHAGRGLCMSCWAGKAPRAETPFRNGVTPCSLCGRRLRSGDVRAEDFPGTLRMCCRTDDGGYQCSTCYDRQRNGRKPLNRRPDNCVKCGVGMYSQGQPKLPGHRHYATRGMCTTCASREWRAEHAKATPPQGREANGYDVTAGQGV